MTAIKKTNHLENIIDIFKRTEKEMRTNPQGFEYIYSEGEIILNLGVTLKGRAIRSNLFSFLKKGFPLLSLTQKQPKK